MADTVEQVYVWDGNDWVPVVRDETVSNTSELTNDGEDGINPFITAADIPAVADKKLPIDSVDGTVVLDSPSANAFTISTGDEQALYLARTSSDADQLVIGENPPGFQGGVGSAGLHIQGVGSAEIKSTLNATGHGAAAGGVITYANNGWNIRDRQSGGGIIFTINPSGDAGTSAFNALGIGGVNGQIRLGDSGSVASPGITYYDDLDTGISRTADDEISIVTGGTSSLIVSRLDVTIPGELITPRIVGPADNDASIELGADAKITVGASGDYGLRVRPDGNIAVGGAGGGTSRLAVQGSVSGSSCYGVNNLVVYDETVRTAFCFSASASWSGDRQADDTLVLYSNAKLNTSVGSADRLTAFRFDITDGTTAAKTNRAFFTNLNEEVGKENYSFFAAGTAPSNFAGDIQCQKLVGRADPSTDASITLAAELLTNNHTPTQPNSIATKQTVDDKIWVGTTAQYNALATKNPTTLYCLTD